MRTAQGMYVEVAVKTLAKESTEMDRIKFLQEAAIMAQFSHPNVVKLYGVVEAENSVRFSHFMIVF